VPGSPGSQHGAVGTGLGCKSGGTDRRKGRELTARLGDSTPPPWPRPRRCGPGPEHGIRRQVVRTGILVAAAFLVSTGTRTSRIPAV
jgi:hypothetical protein